MAALDPNATTVAAPTAVSTNLVPNPMQSLLAQLMSSNNTQPQPGSTPSASSLLNQVQGGGSQSGGILGATGGPAQNLAYLNAIFGGQAAPGVLGQALGSFGSMSAGPPASAAGMSSGLLGQIGGAAGDAGDAIAALFA